MDNKPQPLTVPDWLVNQQEIERQQKASAEVNAETQYRARLTMLQNNSEFPTSNGTINPYSNSEDLTKGNEAYAAVLKDYINNECTSETYDCPQRSFVGHKIHLNVTPENVIAVSEYLKQNKFRHKYLFGGDINDGKIFTIYIGSFDLARKLSLELSQALKGLLAKPAAVEEIEYAPNIVGRFDAGKTPNFLQYGLGVRGISVLRNWGQILLYSSTETKPSHVVTAFRASYNQLAKDFGTYFYGTQAN